MQGPVEMFSFIMGILLAISAAVIFTICAVMQKKGAEQVPEVKMGEAKTFVNLFKNKIWLVGFILGIVGFFPYALGQGFAGAAIVQPLQGTGLILLAIIAIKWFDEKLSKIEIVGIALLVIGPIFLGLSFLQDTPIGNIVPVTDPIFLISLIIFYVIFGTVIFACLVLYKIMKRGIVVIVAVTSGIVFGVGAISSQMAILLLETMFFHGAYLFIPLLSHVFIIVFFAILAAGNFYGTMLAQVGYQKGKAVTVFPIMNVGNLLIPIFAGVIIFRQPFPSLLLYPVLFAIGVVFIFAGAGCMSRIQAEMQSEKK